MLLLPASADRPLPRLGSDDAAEGPPVVAAERGLEHGEDIRCFRSEPQDGQHVLIREGKLGPWALAQYDPTPGVLPRRLGPVFASWEEAEWAVFKLRWKRHTGQDLPLD